MKGSVGEKLKFVSEVNASLITEADQTRYFEVQNGNILKRISGSWEDDGFSIGQSIVFVKDWTGLANNIAASIEWEGTIDSMNSEEIEFTITSGSAPLGQKTEHALICLDKPVALEYSFGFVENSTPENFISPYTNDKQFYYFNAIDTTTPTVHTMVVGGGTSASKSWKSGDATVKYVSSSDPKSIGVDYMHKYEITQEFIINPLFLEAYETAFDNGTQPDEFFKENTIKHIASYTFRTALTNPNTSIVITDSSLLGSVGWFGENYNGYNNPYSVSNLAYTNYDDGEAVDSLQLHQKTRVTGQINGTGFTNTSKLGIYFFWAAPLSRYSSKQDSLQDTFLTDSIIGSMVSGTFTTTGSGRIKQITFNYLSASRVDFEADIEFSSDEREYINPDLLDTISDKYFIGIQAGNTNSVDTSNKVIVQADWQQFVVNNDESGLLTFSNQEFFPHPIDDDENGYTDYKGWKQDGIQYGCTISKNLLANIRNIQVRVIAYSENNQFDLQKYIFDVSDKILVNAVVDYEKLDINTTRGYKLATGDQFNKVFLTFDDPVGGWQDIELKCAVKLDWQSWIKLPNADTIFYDGALDSLGMGKDSSRYIGNGYSIKLVIDVDVEKNVTTRYSDYSPDLKIYDWSLDELTLWGVTIQTFDIDDNDLGGAILKNADTKVVITYTPTSGNTADFNIDCAVTRLDIAQSTGYGTIEEASSLRTLRTGGIFKAVNGESKLKLVDTGTEVVTTILIDFTKLGTEDYLLSGRLFGSPNFPLYQIARDIKSLSEDELLLFNCADNGIAVSNSLRIAQLNADKVIISETAIALSASYTYQNLKLAVSTINTNGKPNFYAVTYTGTATEVHEFIFNGTIYTQTRIYTANIGGSGPTFIRIDPALEPNSKPYIWFGNRDANLGGGDRGCKILYHNGTSWQNLSWVCYDSGSPTNDMCAHPQDIIHDNSNVYVMNYDNPPQSFQYTYGKIAQYYQSSGSTTDPVDRADFSNYSLVYNIQINTSNGENVDGLAGTVGDLAFNIGFEVLEIDANSNPVFLIVHSADNGSGGFGRHFSRLRANIASPSDPDHWTIETPMSATNANEGTPQALRGQASSTIETSPLQNKNQSHIWVIDPNTFVTGHQARFYWVKHVINDWTGVLPNDWAIYSPNNPNYNFTSGNQLT
ncbi:MAG TPA: hypothetical protein VGF79_00810 [Bacteroidia bacterium]